MKIWKKAAAALMAALMAGFTTVPALAAEERTKIESVSLTFTAYDDSEEYGEVEVTSKEGSFSVEDVH